MATTAVLNLGLNSSQFKRGLASSGASLAKFSIAATAGIAAIGVGVVGVAAVIGASFVKAASDADETTNKFNAVFSTLQKSANDTSKALAKGFGLSSREAEKLLGDTGDLLTGFGFTQKSALSLSKSVQELAADLTSFQNFSGGVEGASQAITAALTGETEKMKALGVVIRQDSKEFKDFVKNAVEMEGVTMLQAKALAALDIITRQSKNSIGDYAKTQFQLANLMKKWGKIWDNLKIAIGRFINELLSVEAGAQKFTSAFESMSEKVIGFLSNWQENFKKTFDWILKNAASLLANDIPILFANLTSYIGEVMLIFSKTMTDAFIIVSADLLKIWNKMWQEDMPDGMLKGLADVATKFKERAKNIFSIENLVKDFAIGKVLDLALGKTEESVAEKLLKSVKGNLEKLRAPSDLLKDIDFKSTELELNLKVNEDFKDSFEGLSKNIDDSSLTSKTGAKQQTQKNFAPAVLKGSADAFNIQQGKVGNKTEQEMNKELKKQTKELKTIASSQSNLQIYTGS